MKRFLASPMNRALVLMMVGNVAFGVWIRPDVKRAAAAARAEDAPAWAVALLIASLALLAYSAVAVYLIHITREPPPPPLQSDL
jgi:hypothetical protein